MAMTTFNPVTVTLLNNAKTFVSASSSPSLLEENRKKIIDDNVNVNNTTLRLKSFCTVAIANLLSAATTTKVISSFNKNQFSDVTRRLVDSLFQAFRSQRKYTPTWIFSEPEAFNTFKNRNALLQNVVGVNLISAMDKLQYANTKKMTWIDIISDAIDSGNLDLAVYINALKYFLVQQRNVNFAYLTRMFIDLKYIDFCQDILCLTKSSLEPSSRKYPRVYFKHVEIDKLTNNYVVKTNIN